MDKLYQFSGFLLLQFIIAFTSVNAQINHTPETYAGLKIGYNLARVSFDPAVDQDWYPGFSWGVAFSHISQKSLGIYTELNFSQAGWKTKPDTNGTYSRRLNYLQLPLLTQFNIGNNSSKIIIHIGPCFSYLLNETETVTEQPDSLYKPFIGMPVKNSIDYGLCADIGYFQKTGIGSFQFLARFNQSLGSIFNSSGSADYRQSMNTIIEFSVAYFIEPRKLFKRK